jgi:hypothetical protein
MPISFPQLLDAAEQRLHSDKTCHDLIHALALQIAIDLKAHFVGLSSWDGVRANRIVQVGNHDQEQIVVEDVAAGRVHKQQLSDERQLIRAGAQVAGKLNVVVAVLCHHALAAEDLIGSVAEVVADLYRRRLLENQATTAQKSQQQLELISRLHKTLDLIVVINTMATDGALLTGARTISIAKRHGRHWSVKSATGVAAPNDRADATRRTCTAIASAYAADARCREDAGADDFEESDAAEAGLVVRPLNEPASWKSATWAAVFDFSQDADPPAAVADRTMDVLCHHGALALANCERYSSGSFRSRFGAVTSRLLRPGSLFSVIALCVFAAMLFFVKRELRIEAYGELVPADRLFVFAPEDGTIENVSVKDGAAIDSNAQLCVLSNDNLQMQLEGLQGELSATTARLVAIEALKGQPGSTGQDGLLSAEQLELNERSKSLQKQVVIMQERLATLTMTSRMNGRVYGDRLQELLTHRPVQRGQFLFEIADPVGAWQLELHVPELDIRHVLGASNQSGESLPAVNYALETSPEITRQAVLKSIASSTELQSDGRLSTLVLVDVGHEAFSEERPGTGVVAYIGCGQQRLGYVWFRKIIEFVQRNAWL